MIEYLHKVMRLLVRVLPKIRGYVFRFKVKDGDKGNKRAINVFPCRSWETIRKI